jgi:hypothetical protein
MRDTKRGRWAPPERGGAVAFGGARIHATVWRRLCAWADGSASPGGLGAQLFVAGSLLLGTLLCFGLRATLAACRVWLRRGRVPVAPSRRGIPAAS